jgi:cytochrome c peroxidase
MTMGRVPGGEYRAISFRVGLPSDVNHANPAKYPADHPLNPERNGLHWGWQGGYVFLALEGSWARPNGSDGGYSYHLANDADPMTVTLSAPFTTTGDGRLDLDFDVATLLDGIKIREGVNESTHSRPGDALAQELKQSVTRAFAVQSYSRAVRVARSPGPDKASPIQGTTPYPFKMPALFPQPNLPADNPLTMEGVSLGRELFFDKRLSGNDRQACASCHDPKLAFSDGGHRFSRGIDGQLGRRHAPALFNLAWSHSFTWDGRRTRLRDQALAPIQDAREMHQSLARLVQKLSKFAAYRTAFRRAFGSENVTSERVGLALEQYLYTIVSANSKFDRAVAGKAKLTDQEKQGFLLFITEYDPIHGQRGADCFHCHGGNLFTDENFHNDGLDYPFVDRGRFAVTGKDYDDGKFKTPSLRNVAVTGPYMHDGRFKTLEQVVDHYISSVHRSATLDPNLAKHPDTGMELTKADKRALVAFLKTLTDNHVSALDARPDRGYGSVWTLLR